MNLAIHILAALLTGWLNQHQQRTIEYLREENCALREQLNGRRVVLTDGQAPMFRFALDAPRAVASLRCIQRHREGLIGLVVGAIAAEQT